MPKEKAPATKKTSGSKENEDEGPKTFMVNSEFNALASLIVESANEVEKDNFKLNLFPDQPKEESKLDPQDEGYEEGNVINIDLTTSKNVQKQQVEKIAKQLGKVDINNEELDGDDLLDLMDS